MCKNNNDICQHRSCQAFADFLGGGFGIAAFVGGLQKAKEMIDYKWMSAEEAQKAIAIFRVYPAKAQHATEVLLLDEYARSMKAICHVAADRLACANRKDRKISKERAQAPTPSVLFLAVMCWHRKSSDSCL